MPARASSRRKRAATRTAPASFSWTPKRERFCEEYLVDLNGAAAARRAGFSAKTAKLIASELLAFPQIAERVAALQVARGTRTQVTADRTLEELGVMAFSDLDHYVVDQLTGLVTLAPGAPASAKRAIASVKFKVKTAGDGVLERTTEIRLWNKNDAVNSAMKHLGLMVEKHELTIPPGSGVLAVPVPVTAEQWAGAAAAQQAALAARPAAARPTGS